ncbi:MAG: phosphate ABC transporter permease subunit PstC [Bdellovibrionales bacterium]
MKSFDYKFKIPVLKSDLHFEDRLFAFFIKSLGFAFIALFFLMAIIIFVKAWPALSHFGLSFFVNPNWDSWKQDFGVLSLIYGTLVSSLLALLLSVPLSIAFALFLTELAPKWLSKILGFIVEMLASIPSIIYGMWGVFVLAPFLREHVQPFLSRYFGEVFLFSGDFYGIGMMCAGIILAIMITPTISSICKEVFHSIPLSHKEAVLSLGTTRWEMFKVAILKGGLSGIVGAIVLGFGRAFGETMAVTMVIGNKPVIDFSIFAPSQTMASILATQYAEAGTELHLSSLTAVGFTLFIVSLFFNSVSMFFVWRMKKSFKR